MARMNDSSPHVNRWTTAKLFAELNKLANLESFSMFVYDGINAKGDECADAIREATRLYRQTWMQPIIDELERRIIHPRKDRGQDMTRDQPIVPKEVTWEDIERDFPGAMDEEK